MKKLLIPLLSIIFAVYSLASADSGKYENGKDGTVSFDEDNLRSAWNSVTTPATNANVGDAQRYVKIGFSIQSLSPFQTWEVNETGFQVASFTRSRSFSAHSVEWSGPGQIDYANAELPSAFDVKGSGFGPLSIMGTITRERKSFPESSTMLLLGLSLIGLAGYGGRKKFKR
jgi:LPXTG-motif cell wall-anchored protein